MDILNELPHENEKYATLKKALHFFWLNTKSCGVAKNEGTLL